MQVLQSLSIALSLSLFSPHLSWSKAFISISFAPQLFPSFPGHTLNTVLFNLPVINHNLSMPASQELTEIQFQGSRNDDSSVYTYCHYFFNYSLYLQFRVLTMDSPPTNLCGGWIEIWLFGTNDMGGGRVECGGGTMVRPLGRRFESNYILSVDHHYQTLLCRFLVVFCCFSSRHV